MTYVEVFRDAGSAVGLVEGRVLVQVRWGGLSVPTVEAIGAEARKALRAHVRLGALLIQEPTASIPDGPARDTQRRVIGELVKDAPDVRIAAVVLGDDISARLRRSMGRMLTLGDKRFAHFSTAAEGIAWLSDALDAAPMREALRDAVTGLAAR